MKSNNPKKTIVSGMRPTGLLHLGHYFGVLKNWVELQSQFNCYFFVANWHSLTTEYSKPEIIRESQYQMVIDWLASGVDPQNAVLFLQSDVLEQAELHVLFSMITPISWLERVPSYKELQLELKEKDLSTYGFLGYPLLQTADVAIYKADFVPVGQDQVAHIELSREVIRRFHHIYKTEIFPEPQPLLTKASKLPGLDGRKMSKSYHNSIY
ncbi:MAG: Tryptophanyl-tRNA synthetase, partial [uncultured bacterium]